MASNILPKTLAVSWMDSLPPSWISWVERKTGCPPSSPKDVSKEHLVRVDLFSKIIARLKPLNLWPVIFLCFSCFRYSLAAAIRVYSASKQGNLYTVFCGFFCLFYVSCTGTLRFSCGKRRFPQRELYVSRSGNVKSAFPCFFYFIVLFRLSILMLEILLW